MKTTLSMLVLLSVLAGASSAQTVTPVEVTQISLPTTKDETARTYFVVTLPTVEAPAGHLLGDAFLEFLLDAENVADESASVTLEVYPFSGQAEGALDVSALGKTTMKRTVGIGANKLVRIYVTEFMEASIKNPNRSRSLLVGSMRGDRPGSFSAKTVPGASGQKAKLTIYFDRIEDTVTGQAEPVSNEK
jgi:hypothetical protein